MSTKIPNLLQSLHTDNFKHHDEMYGFNIIIHQHFLYRRWNQISLPNIKDTLLLQKQTPQNKELVEWYS
jgi:hypothetical protein